MKCKTVFISVFVLSTLMLIGMNCGPVPVDITKIQEAVKAQNKKFMEAVSSADASAVAELYTENGQIMPPNNEIVTGKEAIQKAFQGMIDMGIKKVTLTTIDVGGTGETIYEAGNYTMFVDENQIADKGKYIVIWKNVEGIWKLHRDIWNSSMPVAEQQ